MEELEWNIDMNVLISEKEMRVIRKMKKNNMIEPNGLPSELWMM